MASKFAHAAVFAVGAAVGAGVTAAVVRSRRPEPIPSLLAQERAQPRPPALIQAGIVGQPTIVQSPIPPSEIIQFLGNPGPVTDLLMRKVYVAGYDRRLRHPAWTAEHLTREGLSAPPGDRPDRGNSTFREDETLPQLFRATLKDYFRSGYDRGHMVPAADAKSSQDAMDETFLLSNIAPQVGAGFNRHYWAYIEDWCRRLTDSFSDVYVFTVPLYLPKLEADGKWRVSYEVIGNPPNTSVPTHFAKVVLTTRSSDPKNLQVSTGAFVLPNAVIPDDTPLQKFSLPVEAVEKAAGLSIFSDEIKRKSTHICQTASCDVMVRRFDEAQSKGKGKRAISAPK